MRKNNKKFASTKLAFLTIFVEDTAYHSNYDNTLFRSKSMVYHVVIKLPLLVIYTHMVDDKDILAKEIQSWNRFKYALREENATLFYRMLEECLEEDNEGRQLQFSNAINAKGENFVAESLFMVLILQQRRMINQLIQKLSNMKNIVKQQD